MLAEVAAMKFEEMMSMLKRIYFSLIFVMVSVAMANAAYASEQLRIVGSSTVYPFSASVAEHFGKAGDFRTPVVESTGTGAGLKLFCNGIGDGYPYITNASRKILPSEQAECAKNGVNKIIEARFGYDGITFANSVKGPLFKLSRKEIFLALAAEVPKDGKMVKNYYTKWQQIDPALPDVPIKVYGTPPVSGTYDTFIELVMKKGCEQVPELAAIITDKDMFDRKCRTLREDGAFIEAGENGNLIAEKLIGDPDALGFFGFSFLEQNTGKVQGSVIDGITPSFESIQDGKYPISRLLYFYIKADNDKPIAGIKEYAQEFLSEAAIGDEGYLVTEGLVPLPEAERARVRKEVLEQIK